MQQFINITSHVHNRKREGKRKKIHYIRDLFLSHIHMFQKKLQPYIPPLLATSFASAPSANSTPISAMADHRNDVVENDFINPHKHVQYNLNSKIMLTAIISLSLVVVLVTVLHIYSRCLLRRQARQRAALHQLRRVVSIPEPPKTGLSLAVIAALPMFPFRQTNGFDETGQIDCAVCLSVLENDDLVRMLPNCKHTFHAECIDKWLVSNSTCPVCRSHAEPRLVLEPLEAAQPSAPPAEPVNSNMINQEGSTSESSNQNTSKISIGSRLSSFRRILTRERSWCRIQNYREELGLEDLERQ